ncbi:unnamed protein product [Durusdinium trenchii]|uniref:Uncharacterized protein n=1 Tax=Durusdinium trenchii TaxID=1381693 RepID=A0ABP0PCF2_9DINO
MTIPQNRAGWAIATPHALSVSRDERRRALSEVSRRKNPIPGYTGHLDGHKVENVFGATFGEALLVGEAARHRRARGCQPGDDVVTRRTARTHNFDNGSLNTTWGSKLGHDEPLAKTTSVFHNHRGHGIRAGAAVPGYCGFIPSKVAGNCFGKRMALDNLHATEMRKINDEGAEWRTNWIVASETNKKRLAHGAFAVKENFQFTREAPTREAPGSTWKLYEPPTAQQWIRY